MSRASTMLFYIYFSCLRVSLVFFIQKLSFSSNYLQAYDKNKKIKSRSFSKQLKNKKLDDYWIKKILNNQRLNH